jgi:hypothetical protein
VSEVGVHDVCCVVAASFEDRVEQGIVLAGWIA